MLKGKGFYNFDPLPLTGNATKLFKPGWMIITVPDDISNYYSWFIRRRYGLKLMPPAWGPHISIIRGEGTKLDAINWLLFKQKYHEKKVEFDYDIDVRTNGEHWWLKIYNDEIKDIREEMGLKRDPFWNLHLTIGSPVPVQMEHSEYLYRGFQTGLIY